MSFVQHGRPGLAEAMHAGAIVGVIEACRVGWMAPCSDVGALAVVASLACVAAALHACGLLAILALARKLGPVARWSADHAAGGARRSIALGRVAVLLGAVAGFTATAFAVIVTVHRAFPDAATMVVALIASVALTPTTIAIVFAAHLAYARVPTWLAARPVLVEGARAWLAGAALVAATLAIPLAAIARFIPNLNLAPIVPAICTFAAVLALRLLHVGRHRGARIAALGLLVACLAGVSASSRGERARLLVVEHGGYSKWIAKAIWHVADRDGDGYAGSLVGGADCDDDNAARSPGRVDIAGNRVDENCTGADAPRPAPRSPTPADGGAPRPNVLVISVDTLRADHLGAWGYRRPTSPSIDAFARTAVRFAWAMTSSPSTQHALPSMFTGRYASANATRAPVPRLAERLRDAGWATRAVMCCRRIGPPSELGGFTVVDTAPDEVRLARPGQVNADAVADATIDALAHAKANAQPFFTWVHLYDPHDPYRVPPGGPDFGDTDEARYDAEIAFADRGIGRILAAIDRLGLASSTIVVLTSDHGEEFGEHGIRFHARSLYTQVVRIPLLIRVPGGTARVVQNPVSLVDLTPTLLDLAGLDATATTQGRSLAQAILGGAEPDHPVLVELVPERFKRDAIALVTPAWKVIWDREANAWQLFARTDEADRDDLAEREPATLARMKAQLLDAIDRELAQPAATSAL